MRVATLTNDVLSVDATGSRQIAVTRVHARMEFLYRPAALPAALHLSEADSARLSSGTTQGLSTAAVRRRSSYT